jgi:hypothetical protein
LPLDSRKAVGESGCDTCGIEYVCVGNRTAPQWQHFQSGMGAATQKIASIHRYMASQVEFNPYHVMIRPDRGPFLKNRVTPPKFRSLIQYRTAFFLCCGKWNGSTPRDSSVSRTFAHGPTRLKHSPTSPLLELKHLRGKSSHVW